MRDDLISYPLNILVVDDEPDVCKSIYKILNRNGHTVKQALSVAAALEMVDAERTFDLIIADLMMPQAGGLDLLNSIRESRLETPVLIITGFSTIPSAVQAMKLGAGGYLAKPFTPEELEKAAKETLHYGLLKIADSQGPESEKILDVDLPFNPKELEAVTSEQYVENVTRSDIPTVARKPPEAADFCSLGQRSCKRFVK